MRQLTDADYARAERFLPWNVAGLVRNVEVRPHWLDGGRRFWYLRETRSGREFVTVDAATGGRTPSFDHAALAGALEVATRAHVDPACLPFGTFRVAGAAIRFSALGRSWVFDTRTHDLAERREPVVGPDELPSPDGRWAAFARDHNLYVRSLDTGMEHPLTTDGEAHHAYGASPEANLITVTSRRLHRVRPPVAVWSPDSRRLLTHRLDERAVAEFHLVQSVPDDGGARPRLHTYRMPVPGDDHVALAAHVMFEVQTGRRVDVTGPPFLATHLSPLETDFAWWDADGTRVYAIEVSRAAKRLRFYEIDVASGGRRLLIEETGETFVQPSAHFLARSVHVTRDGTEIIWFSERDGWGHLYLYDGRTGALIRQLTTGEFVVREIHFVDEGSRLLYFTAGGLEPGRNPYYRHLYRVSLDGGAPQLLTPENADHVVPKMQSALQVSLSPWGAEATDAGFSPSGHFFVETHSRADCAPVSTLRRTDGTLVATLERADVDDLLAEAWRWPEPFVVKARDGRTDIYGLLYLPVDFDPVKIYPVLDITYPGPHATRTPATSFVSELSALGWYTQGQAYAELGCAVVTLDGLGTPLRSKAFRDVAYRNIQDAGLPDHIAGIRQLAAQRPYLDLSRVGILGHSAGGYGAARAILQYPDFFHVAVSSAGPHDLRGYLAMFGEYFLGPLDDGHFDATRNAALAEHLHGRLLLAVGELDENTHPALTLRLVEALVRANKDFELLMMPNADHTVIGMGYYIRRTWDFLVRHLLAAEPPREYHLSSPLDWPPAG